MRLKRILTTLIQGGGLSLSLLAVPLLMAAGNNYVNVSSDTTGVVEIIPVSETDFDITTANVSNQFKADVTVTGKSPWVIKPDDPMTDNLAPGGSIGYTVEHSIEPEPLVSGTITLFKVEVVMGAAGEDGDSSSGAFLPYSYYDGVLLSDDNIASMMPVTIRCLPQKHAGDSINIVCNGGLLYEKVGSSYKPAQESYPVEGIESRAFHILGSELSSSPHDFEIKATHSANECEGSAKYTVFAVQINESEIELLREETYRMPLVVIPAGIGEFLDISTLGVSVSGFDGIHLTARVSNESGSFAVIIENLISKDCEDAWQDDHQWIEISGVVRNTQGVSGIMSTSDGQNNLAASNNAPSWKRVLVSVWCMKDFEPLFEKGKAEARKLAKKGAGEALGECFKELKKDEASIEFLGVYYPISDAYVDALIKQGKRLGANALDSIVWGEELDGYGIAVRESMGLFFNVSITIQTESFKIKFGDKIIDDLQKRKFLNALAHWPRVSADLSDLSSDFYEYDKTVLAASITKVGRVAAVDWKAKVSAESSFYDVGSNPDEGRVEWRGSIFATWKW